MLQVSGLTTGYGETVVVRDLSFEVRPGEVVALVGVNRAGKTTTLRAVVGLDIPMSGSVSLSLDGETFPLDEREPRVRRAVCALLDDGAWFPALTVAEHLMLYANAHEQPLSLCQEALEELHLTPLADRLPATLSSGQTQRLKLAQGLVRPWELLILDEPEQRLDDAGRAWLGDYLRRVTDSGRAVLMASHDPDVRQAAQARVVHIHEGA